MTALHLAAQFSSSSVVAALLQAGADVKALDSEQCSPLHLAVKHNEGANVDVVKMLAANGADVTAALFIAVKNKNANVVKMLLEAGADVTAVGSGYECTPLHFAAEHNKSADVIRALVEAGAAVDARDKKYQRTPLHVAARENKSVDVIRALVKAGAAVDACDEDQWTPLYYAAYHNQCNVQPLIECGANVNLLDNGQRSPLYWAARNNNREAVTALCKAGADPNLGEISLLNSGYFNDEMESLIREGIKKKNDFFFRKKS